MKANPIADKSFDFALDIVFLYKHMLEAKEFILSKQLLRSGTSIGANVVEATAALTKKEFISKMSIASKEARETLYWLRLLEKSKLVNLNFQVHMSKANELVNILTSIIKTAQERAQSHSKLNIQNS